MDIYQHFSCFTKLPIKIDDIVEFMRERGIVENLHFCEVDIDPSILWAQFRAYRMPAMYGESIVYEVHYSRRLSESQRRLACCKELLHVLDAEGAKASTQAEVELLIQQMSVPPHSGISLPAADDHSTVARALMLLVPRDCLTEFKAAYDQGDMSADEVAAATGIPVEYAQVTLLDQWSDMIKKIN